MNEEVNMFFTEKQVAIGAAVLSVFLYGTTFAVVGIGFGFCVYVVLTA